ncbi:DoxX-like family protein [Lysinibacillus sp. 3P01SB]|uniref:DoxX-like family protein n=1 Tax=Lysinibacillus sp. 3P01SB TaxID=3132284 RepID=UPI0039A45076
MKKTPIYVEIEMDTDIETIWKCTQQPQLHEQWDLRFSSITYNEKESDEEPQTFTYTTNVVPGISISGWGVSKGTHEKKSGIKTSSLHFGTEQLISPIAEGKGYWQYLPHKDGVTFLTQYDYEVRFGMFGKFVDLIFKPMMGWATALSFDVLKRWIETGEPPAMQYRRFFSYTIISMIFFIVWFYQGLVPKIWVGHPQEIEMLMALSGLSEGAAGRFVLGIGIAEVLFGVAWLLQGWRKNFFLLQIVVFPLLTVTAIAADGEAVISPFNVITFNLALWVLSIVGYLLSDHVPTAKSCIRKKGQAA